jgi:hypothetical protein
VDPEGRELELGFDHPIQVSAEEISGLFSSLKFSENRLLLSDRQGQVFTAAEIDKLAQPLAQALHSAVPNERIRFLSVRRERTLIFDKFLGTSGVIFASEPGRIEVAFDLIQEEQAIDDGNPILVRFHREPTALQDSAVSIQTPPGIHKHRHPAGEYPCWLSIPKSELQKLGIAWVENNRRLAAASPAASAAIPDPSPGSFKELSVQYKGCRIFQDGGNFYGLPASEGALDPNQLKKGGYRLFFKGRSLAEVTQGIDQADAAGLLK